MGYLTACTFYAALFNRSPEGLPIETVNGSRSKGGKPAQDPDGEPLKRTFAGKDRADLQRIAWEGLKQFQQVAASTGQGKPRPPGEEVPAGRRSGRKVFRRREPSPGRASGRAL